MKPCETKFRPICYLMIFCNKTCYEKSGLKEYWEALWTKYSDDAFRLARRLRKKKYLQTEKGKEQHRRAARRRYWRKKAQRLQEEAKQSETPGSPDQTSAPETSSVPVTEQNDTAPALSPPLETDNDTSTQQESSCSSVEEQMTKTKRRGILRILFSGKARAKIDASDLHETVSPPVDVTPRQCKRPGCDEIVVPRSSKISKKFCSKDCVDAIRNALQTLRTAYKATRCPHIRLLTTLLTML